MPEEGGWQVGWAFILVIVAAVFLLILSLSKITLRLRYRRLGKDDHFALEFSLWHGIIHYKLEIPLIKMQVVEKEKTRRKISLGSLLRPVLRPAFKIRAELEGKGGKPVAEEKKKVPIPGPARLVELLLNAVRTFKKYYPVVLFMFERVKLSRFHWQTEIGTGEPSQTGILVGTAWGLKGFLLSLIYRLFAPGVRPVINIAPSYEKTCFNTFLDCIFEVRIGHIILTGFKMLVVRLK